MVAPSDPNRATSADCVADDGLSTGHRTFDVLLFRRAVHGDDIPAWTPLYPSITSA